MSSKSFAVVVTVLSLSLVACVGDGADPESERASADGGVSVRKSHHMVSNPGVDAGHAQVSLDENDPFTAAYGQFTVVPYFAELYDRLDNYNLWTKKFIAHQSTSYAVCASLASFAQDFELDIFINDVRERAFAVARNGVAQGCRTVYLTDGQRLDVRVYQSAVPSMTFARNLYWNWMTVYTAQPVVAVVDSAAFQEPSDGQFTQVPYNVVQYNGWGAYDPATSRFISPGGGYQVCAALASFVPDFELDTYLDGVRSKALAVSSYGAATGCRNVRIAQGSVLDLRAYQGSVASMAFSPNSYWNWLTVDYLPSRVSLSEIRPFTLPSDTGRGFTTVPYDHEVYDDYNEFDPATGQFTASENGDFEFCASLASFTGTFELDLFINGYRENAFAMSKHGAATGCRVLRMKKGDYARIRAHQETGTPINFNQTGYWNWLTIAKH